MDEQGVRRLLLKSACHRRIEVDSILTIVPTTLLLLRGPASNVDQKQKICQAGIRS